MSVLARAGSKQKDKHTVIEDRVWKYAVGKVELQEIRTWVIRRCEMNSNTGARCEMQNGGRVWLIELSSGRKE